jgi:ABC-type Mn2+/Zn2+ transport system permease subunit
MNNELIYSLISAIFIGGAGGYLGSLMISKRMSLVGDALGHVALPGMGLAILFGLNVSLGAFVFLLIGVLLIWKFEDKTELPMETLVGIVFVLSLAIGFLVTPEPELLEALFGDISQVSLMNMAFAVVLSVLMVVFIKNIYLELMLSSASPDFAAANKIKVKRNNLIYLLAIAVVVALGVKVAGSLLVGALVIVPAASARLISGNLKQYSFWSAFFGVLSAIIGIALFKTYGLMVGPMVILANVFFFAICFFLRKK